MKILAAVDLSQESKVAMYYLGHLLEGFNTKVDVLYVKPEETEFVIEEDDIALEEHADGELDDEERKEIEEDLSEMCRPYFKGKAICETKVVVGDPAEEILQRARLGSYDMIVLGAHGQSFLKGLLMGTVHTKVLHNALCPVLLVREMHYIDRVLVVYRGSRCDQSALHFIAPMLSYRNPKVTILYIDEPKVKKQAGFAQSCLIRGHDTLDELGHTPETKTVEGDFTEETLKEIQIGDYDLVVIGAYGYKKPKHLKLLCDETIHIMNRTTRPILVYRDRLE